MGKHTIYLSDKLETEIRATAQKEGWSLTDVVRKRLETGAAQLQYQQKVENLEKKIDIIYALIDLTAGDMGYVIGATRASTCTIEDIAHEGHKHESYVKRIAAALKINFEKIASKEGARDG